MVLTEDGQDRLEAARTLWREAQARFEAAFGADMAKEFRGVLDRIGSEEFARSFKAAQS